MDSTATILAGGPSRGNRPADTEPGFQRRPWSNLVEAVLIEGGFELAKQACNKKGRKSKFQVWMTASVDRYNEVKDTTAVVSTEPFRVKTPKCDALKK